mgnify:CR=1 FL=1
MTPDPGRARSSASADAVKPPSEKIGERVSRGMIQEALETVDLRAVMMPIPPPPPVRRAVEQEQPEPSAIDVEPFQSDSPIKLSSSLLERPTLSKPKVDADLTLSLGDFQPRSDLGSSRRRTYSKGEVDQPPIVAYRAKPSIPGDVLRKHKQIRVVYLFAVSIKGEVEDIRPLRPFDPLVDERVADALRVWQFRPAIKDGERVSLSSRKGEITLEANPGTVDAAHLDRGAGVAADRRAHRDRPARFGGGVPAARAERAGQAPQVAGRPGRQRGAGRRSEGLIMRVEIITPDKALFKGDATSVTVPGVDGSMGFLENHAPLITVLKAGEVKVRTTDGTKEFPVKGGVVEVMNNTVIVLAE